MATSDYPFAMYGNTTNTTYQPQTTRGTNGYTPPSGYDSASGYYGGGYTSTSNETGRFNRNPDGSPTFPAGYPPVDPGTQNYPLSYGRGGGGGGGGAPAFKPDFSPFGGWAAQTQPGMMAQGDPLKFAKYAGVPYFDWDPSGFDKARAGVQQGIGDARKRQGDASQRAMQQYLNYQDPYAGGPQATNPGVDPRLMASMQAWGGAGSNAAAQTWDEGVQADDAMRSVYDLLGNVGKQYNADNLAGVRGDEMQAMQALDQNANELGLGVDMAQARAHNAWKQADWENRRYGYDKRYDTNNAAQTANWQRGNQVNDTNTQTTNAWNQDILGYIWQMINSDGKNRPEPGNDLSKLISMPQFDSSKPRA